MSGAREREGQGCFTPSPPHPFWWFRRILPDQVDYFRNNFIYTKHFFFQGILSELVTSGKKINYAFVDFGNSNKMKRCVILE